MSRMQHPRSHYAVDSFVMPGQEGQPSQIQQPAADAPYTAQAPQ